MTNTYILGGGGGIVTVENKAMCIHSIQCHGLYFKDSDNVEGNKGKEEEDDEELRKEEEEMVYSSTCGA